jgi:guanylate kinase
MRPGEVEGQDYFFVTAAQFEAWIAAGDALLEHAVVYGEYKGIPRGQVDAALARGADVVLRIDVQVRVGVCLCGVSLCVGVSSCVERAEHRTPVIPV